MMPIHKHDLDEDGEAVWRYQEGQSLPGGALAVDRLGVGTRCETWLAWSTDLWCPVIVKLARPHQVTNQRAIRSLRREVTALTGATHPALPRLIADGTADATPHLLMEYIDGPALDEELERVGPIPVTDAALLGVQILAAVADLHRRGLVHLDLKPANIVLRDGRPVVVDFGSTRRIGTPQPTGHPVGTAGYAAPEQEECRPISPTMDCYGVGSILYEALIDDINGFPTLPLELSPIVIGLLATEPEHRLTVPQAMLALARKISADRRPWPKWADRHLPTHKSRPGRRGGLTTSPDPQESLERAPMRG
jgi:eukaryotic-like serine/threonine-protein kinase